MFEELGRFQENKVFQAAQTANVSRNNCAKRHMD